MWPLRADESMMTDAWEQVKIQLGRRLTSESFQNWFAKTTLESMEDNRLCVRVPNSETRDWIEKEFSSEVTNALRDLKLPYREVVFLVGESRVQTTSAFESQSVEQLFGAPAAHLNARYTFDAFVVGSCNQFAHAAAKAVATQPARSYNPLMIYGGSGMGKTHLIHAIGHEVAVNYPSMRVVYTTTERFVNQFVHCIRTKQMQLFQQYYRSADVLLVDDVQSLTGKEGTQEEFFHTFNDLYDHQKQIVLSSDSPPKNIPNLVDRLRSRFEWGLLVDVQAPDLETKLAILDMKAEREGVHIPEDARVFIATKMKSNVRELEGALVKLIAYSSVSKTPISLDMAKQMLRHLTVATDRKVTIESVIRAVAERFQLQPVQLKQKTNQRHIAYPRQVAMYLTKELTDASLPEIGRAFGGKHHTTVLHSVQKIERERHLKGDLNRLINSVIDSYN